MKPVDVSSLKLGTVCTKPIYFNEDQVALQAFQPITEQFLNMLKARNLQILYSDGALVEQEIFSAATGGDTKEKEEASELYQRLKKSFQGFSSLIEFLESSEKTVESAFQASAAGKNLPAMNLQNLATEIIKKTANQPEMHILIFHPEQEASQASHSVSVAILCATTAHHLNFSEEATEDLVLAALLQYVGLANNPVYLQKKGQKLTAEEKAVLHKHPVQAYQSIKKSLPGKERVAQLVLSSQEHFDGSGFPQQKGGDAIPQHAMVLHIIDSYVAMTEAKSYRAARLPNEAMKELINSAGFEYQPLLVKAFLSRFSMYPLGSYVELSNGQFGFVLGFHKEKPLRPAVVITRDSDKKLMEKLRLVNLFYRTGLYIVKGLQPKELNTTFQKEFEYLLLRLESINSSG